MNRIIFLFFLVFLLLPKVQAAEQELLDRVVAVVNDEVITQAELDTFLRPIYEAYSKEYQGEELMKMVQEARQKILSQMIEDKLVYQEAVKQGIEVKEEDVEKEFDDFKRKMEKPEELDLMLEKEGMTMKAFKERLRKQAMVRQLHDREIRAKVVISPVEVEDFYKQNPDKFRVKERVRVRSLTIKKSGEAREKGIPDEKAAQQIQILEQRIRLQNNFEEVIKRFSEDSHAKQEGLGDWIERGSMIESVDEVLFNTPLGQLTQIVETPIGYHIFRVTAKEPAQERKLDEVKDQIMNYLYQQKSNTRFREWMEEIKRNAYISIR
ncbi:MAG TPA: SurA N-terminal domain-containing protein [Candidatus Omnitrophota bacterium]|nr:SurA N-terminal domain-containing protein [Candidatus Omnitrophota bacterium]